MRGSVTIATIFGTKVRVHLTFVILLAWVAAGEALTRGAGAAAIGTLFVLLLFACVVAHEFGHVLVARHYDSSTRDILLLPIGGISRMERMPERPMQELAVAVAGPAVSIAIGTALTLLVGLPTVQSIESPALDALLPRLAVTNLFLALFNLLPAFPMDGGRALRAILAMRIGASGATRIAARFGHGIAASLFLFGLLAANPFLLLIAVFVYFGASAEAADSKLRQLAQNTRISDVMRSNVRTIGSRATLADGIELMLHAGQHAIPVTGTDGSFLGVLTKEKLVQAIQRSGVEAPISDAALVGVPLVRMHESLVAVLDAMRTSSAPAVLIVDSQGNLAGMLTSEMLSDLMAIPASTTRAARNAILPHARVSVPHSI